MTQPSTQRPPQVTLAGSVIMFASVLVVLTAWDNVSNLRSLETRETLQVWVDGPFQGSGLDMETAISVLHVSSLVAGTCAAATAGLGWLVMRRDKAARLALAVLAVPIFLAGLLLGGFASSFVAAAAAMLWLSPAKEWFATGRWTPPAPRSRQAEEARRPVWPPVGPGTDGTSRAPRDAPPPHPGAHPAPPHPGAHPATPPPPGPPVSPYGAMPPAPWGVVPQRRPQALVTAVVLTIVPSVFAAALALMALAVGLTGMEPFMDQLERQQPDMADDLTTGQWRNALLTFGVVTLALSSLAVTFAAFVAAGHEWARRGLMMTAAFCAGVCFLMAIAAAPVLLFAGAAVATVVLLNRPESRDWCRSHRTTRRT